MSNKRSGHGFCVRGVRDDPPGSPIKFIASSEVLARDGKVLKMADFDLEPFKANPVFLWSHTYDRPPIGRVSDIWVQGPTLQSRVVFDQGDPFAKDIERKYREGFLRAVSIGWGDVKRNGNVVHELYDVSAVAVGSDPTALLTERQIRSLRPYDVNLPRRRVSTNLIGIEYDLILLMGKLRKWSDWKVKQELREFKERIKNHV